MSKIRIIGDHHTLYPHGTVLEVVPNDVAMQHNPSWVWPEHATVLVATGAAEWVGASAPEPPPPEPQGEPPLAESPPEPTITPAKAWSVADGPKPGSSDAAPVAPGHAWSIADAQPKPPASPAYVPPDDVMSGKF